jgi:hypothetical protein
MNRGVGRNWRVLLVVSDGYSGSFEQRNTDSFSWIAWIRKGARTSGERTVT